MGTEHLQDEQYPHKDFFINYAPADSNWAEWIAWHLERNNYSVTLSKWDFLPGSNSILELNKALTSTEQTIVILSPHYMNAIHTLPDWTVTFKRDISGEHKRLIPVQVQQAEVEGLFSTIDLPGHCQRMLRAPWVELSRIPYYQLAPHSLWSAKQTRG